jgi:hypothetical protein
MVYVLKLQKIIIACTIYDVGRDSSVGVVTRYGLAGPGIVLKMLCIVKGKAIPLEALRGPEVSRSLRLPDFKTIGT